MTEHEVVLRTLSDSGRIVHLTVGVRDHFNTNFWVTAAERGLVVRHEDGLVVEIWNDSTLHIKGELGDFVVYNGRIIDIDTAKDM